MMTASVMAEGHMKFKGIEIAGKPGDFADQLQTKGFEYIGDMDGIDVLEGDFAGYKKCMVWIIADQNEVVRVNVTFPSQSAWSPLYDNYTTIKKMLTTKYGKPTIDKEEWQGYRGKPEDDRSCLHELIMDRVKIFSAFEAENGSIELQIMKLSHTSFGVIISYFDNESQERLKSNAIDDL